MVTPPAARFDVTAITLAVAGQPAGTIDAHLTTRLGEPREIVTVTLGDLVVYCHDLTVVRQFASTWATTPGYALTDLPTELLSAGVDLRTVAGRLGHGGAGRPPCASTPLGSMKQTRGRRPR